MNTSDTQNTDTTRPFGFWIKAVDRLMAAEFAAAFEGEHANRRDWRLLNAVDGTAPAHRPLSAHKLHSLVERGWVVAEGDGWALTDDGRAAKDRLGGIVDGIRAKVTDAVNPEDLSTTIATLEQITRAFGWDEETPLPHGHKHRLGRRHGFGPRGFGGRGFGGHGFGRHGRPFGPGFGAGFGPGFDRDFGPDAEHGDHGCGHRGHRGRPGHDRAHRGHGADRFEGGEHGARDASGEHGFGGHRDHRGHLGARAARAAQHAFERGFDAGYSRGRDA